MSVFLFDLREMYLGGESCFESSMQTMGVLYLSRVIHSSLDGQLGWRVEEFRLLVVRVSVASDMGPL